MKRTIWCLCFSLLSLSSFGVTLTKEWAVADYSQPSGRGLNSMAYDPVTTQLINPNFGSDLSLEKYKSADGSFVESSPLSGASFGSLAGFGIGVSEAGAVYLSDSYKLYKLDNPADTTVTSIQGSASFENPCRNISIQGSGIDTYMASTGSTDNGPVQIWKADDAACSSFSPWKTLMGISLDPMGAGKAGCALSPVTGTDPPQWVAGGEVYGEQYLRLFRYNASSSSYEHAATIGGKAGDIFPCYDAGFDFTKGFKPILATLTTSGHADPNIPENNGFNVEAMVEIFELNPHDGSLISRATYDLTNDLNRIGNRGSLEIDPVNKKIYIGFRCEGGTNHLAMACLSYTLDPEEPTPTPTPTTTAPPTPSPSPTATPVPTQTPEVLIVEGYEEPSRGLRWKEAYVSQAHGYTWNDAKKLWGWQRPLIEGTREDLITAMFCNRWLLPYFENAGAMTTTARERDENTTEVIANFNSPADPTVITGTWTEYTGGSPLGGSSIMAQSVAGSEPTASVAFTLDIPESGWYCLYIRHPLHPNPSHSVPYIVIDGSGTRHQYLINQSCKPDHWYYLSRFYFEAGSNVPVLEINNADGKGGFAVLADAVRIGGGMGSYDWGGGVSRVPRWQEFAKAWTRYVGAPSWVWDHPTEGSDYTQRKMFRDWECPENLHLEIHSNAATGMASGSYAMIYARNEAEKSSLYSSYIRMAAAVQSWWDPSWLRRTPSRQIDPYWSPMLLIELAFHDNVERDLIFLMDPDFRHIIARGLYSGTVDYFTDNTGVYLPEAPSAPFALSRGKGRVLVGWEPPLFGTEAEAYRIYYSRHPHCFTDYITIDAKTFQKEMSLDPDSLYYFQIRSVNDGGVSFPTETLSAFSATSGTSCLIVNGFDRLDWKVQETENTRNFVIQHATSVLDAAVNLGRDFSISSSSNEAVAKSLVSLDEFSMVDWISGEESVRYDITFGKGFTDDRVFSPEERDKIKEFLVKGGRIFLSGSDIAWDLENHGDTSGKEFLNDILRCGLIEDDASSDSIEGVGGLFNGVHFLLDDGTFGIYDVDSPDALGVLEGGEEVLRFTETTKTAGIIRQGPDYYMVLFSFPFEAIVGNENRSDVMEGVLCTLFPELFNLEAETIVKYMIGEISLSPEDRESADANGDGRIDVADVVNLLDKATLE